MIQVMPTPQCAICAFAIPGLKIRTCSLCQMTFHQVCYFENRSRPSPDCQACAHVMDQKRGKKQKLQPVCFICNLNDGLLKEVSSNKFGHVLCVLTSKNIKIQSYKQFTIAQKQPAVSSICQQCKKQSSHLIQCQLCSYRAHLTCLPSEQEYVGQNLLENLKQNNLMEIALSCSAQQQTMDLILKCKPHWKNYNKQFNRLAICSKQSKKYCWCFCGNPNLNNEQKNPSILCDGCNRYVHLSCTGMKDPDQIKSYYCPGCKTGDKYRRYAKLPDLIQQIIRLQQANFKLSDLRTIDSFPYILSNKLIKNLTDQKQKLINYLAIKAIGQMASPKNKSEKIGHNHFYDLIKDIIGSNARQKNNQEIWEMYCQMLNRLDPSNSIAVSLMKPPQSEESERQNKMNQTQQQLQQHISKLNDLIEDNAVSQIPNMLRYLCIIRHAIHKFIEIKTIIQQNMNKNLLFALLLFWCSSKNQEKILQIVLNNYLKKTKITIRQLQKLKTLKRKGCPHFKSDAAWDLIQSSLQVIQDQQIQNSKHQYEESKIQEYQNGNQEMEAQTIIAKAIQNRQFNSKIYGVLKKRINRQGFQQQNRSLKIFYQWSVLSKKIYFGLQKRKMSISGINQAWKLMKRCKYPKNGMRNKVQSLFEYIKPVRKLMKKLQVRKRVERNAEEDMELYQFLCKPTLQQVRQCIFKLKQSKYQEVWGDLEVYELQQILIKHQQLQGRVKNIFEINEHKFNTTNLEQKQNSTQSVENQQLKQIVDPKEVLEIKRKIKQSNVSFVHLNQLYKINDLVISAETTLKKRKWQGQKISQAENQKQLINDLSKVIKQLNAKTQFQNLTYNDILSNEQFEKQVIEKLQKQDQNKAAYLNKHITRNKKWLQDVKYLKNGVIKTMTFQDISYFQQKLRTSIFDLSKLIQQVILPLKRKCIETRERLQQIVPYCQQLPSNLTMRENIYNPQNKLYKQIRQLTVKDYVLKLYEKDCEMLKNLSSLLQKLSKKLGKQDFPLLLQQFQDTYKRLTPYLHQVKTVWDLIFKVFTKIIEFFNQTKSQFNKNQKFLILQKYKRLVKILDRFIDVNDCPENKRKMQELQQLLQQEQLQV